MPKRSFSIPRPVQYVVLGVASVAVAAMVWSAVQPVAPPVSANERPTFNLEAVTVEDPAAPFYVRPADRPLEVVFAGDSLTYGLFASTEAAGYRPQVVAALEAGGAVTATRGGQTGNQVKTVSDSITFPATTGIAVLALGTNDVWKTPVPDFSAHYAELLAKVEASAPDAAVVCLGVWANADGARNYDPLIQEPCEAAGGQFVKIADLFDQPGTRGPAGAEAFGGLSDDFHPNDTGYAAIAQRVTEALG